MGTNKTSAGQGLPPLRILLVEDSEHDQLAFRRAFKKSQMPVEITTHERAEKALEQLTTEATSFDLVVADHKLPGMSGLDLCQELLEREVLLPLVILTGTGTEHLAVEALKAGVDDYMIKDPAGGYLELLPVVLPDVVQSHHDRLVRQRTEERIGYLNRLKEDLLSPRSLGEKLKLITDGVVAIFDADFARIWIIQPGDLCDSDCLHTGVVEGPHICRYRDRCLHLMASSGRYSHLDGEVHRRVPFGCYKIGRVAAGEDPKFITNDVTHDPYVHDHDWARKLGLVSFAGYRLLSATGEPIGVLALFGKHVISPDEDALLEDLANTTAQVIQTAKAEEALRKSEQEKAAILDNMSELVTYQDSELRLLWANRKAGESVGLSPEQLTGRHCYEIWQQRDEPCVGCPVVKAYKSGQPEKAKMSSPDGRVWFIRGYPLRNANGEVERLVEVTQDITERVRAEEALRESEKRFRSLVETTSDWVWEVDQNAIYTYASPKVKDLLGYEPEELIGKTPFDLMPPDEAECLAELFQAVMETMEPFTGLENTNLHKDGHQVILETSGVPFFDTEGVFCGYRGIDRDITERKRTEETLWQRNRELELLNQAGQAFNSTLELDDVLITVLEEIRQMLEVVACSAWLIDPEMDELVCRQSAGSGSEIVRHWRLAYGQGIAGWVAHHDENLIIPDTQADRRHFDGVGEQTGLELRSVLAVPLRVRGGVIGVLEVVDDKVDRFTATDLTLVELLASAAATAIDNARLYEQARQDAETKSVLLREVNHRVKNNLSAILGLLSIERRHAAQEQSLAYQALVNDLTNRIKGLGQVHSLLSAAQWQPLLLSDLAQRIIRTALPSLPGGKSVSVTVTPSPVRVTPDQAHNLALIINELATNTVKHALPERNATQITVRITLDGDTVQYEFRDDGPGYAPDVLRGERQNVGMYLVQTLAHKGLRGEVDLGNDWGAVTIIRFKAMG